MKALKYISVVFIVLVFFSGSAFAQDFYIYPNNGQTIEQQKKDEFECFQWAKQKTGYDPTRSDQPPAPSPPPKKEGGQIGLLEGAIIGGASGAGIGALSAKKSKRGKRALKGGLIGAGVGALLGETMKRSQESKQTQPQAQQQTSTYYQQRDEYNRAFGLCLESRGYTVK
jgi:hypothetical protein